MGVPLPAVPPEDRRVTMVVCVDTSERTELWYCLVPNEEVTPALDALLTACDGTSSSFYTRVTSLWRGDIERLEVALSELATKGRASMHECTESIAVPPNHLVTRVCTMWYT